MPYWGSGPDPVSHYYTTEQYQDILRHAKKYHVDIIPEIDFPGHAQAAIIAMRARYFKYARRGNMQEARKFLLIEENELIHPYQLYANPCFGSTFTFIEYVIQQLVEIHKDISPLTTIHLGGDEVEYKDIVKTKSCQELRAKGVRDIKLNYVSRVIKMAAKYKVNVYLWEDIMYDFHNHLWPPASFVVNKPVVNAWRTSWKHLLAHRAYQMANAGYEVCSILDRVMMTNVKHITKVENDLLSL